MLDLALLLWAVRLDYDMGRLGVDDYCEACGEVGRMAFSMGYSHNDLARLLVAA